jgi:hypothetical protein
MTDIELLHALEKLIKPSYNQLKNPKFETAGVQMTN